MSIPSFKERLKRTFLGRCLIVLRRVLIRPIREREELRRRRTMFRLYSQFINKGDLCFDVGANIGNRTEIFLKIGASVVAVEPQDICMQQLRKKYGANNRVMLVHTALGDKDGEAEMVLSDASTISSLSKEWINAVKTSGRFSGHRWDKSVIVPVTTLDKLITDYGKPVFCKIDVEGFEFQVLKGLSQPIKIISFEFTPEFIDSTLNSIKHLSTIETVQFNYSIGESMRLTLSKWVGPEEICEMLESIQDKTFFGDIYARFTE